MKTEKKFLFIVMLAVMFCMALTCASAAVEEKDSQPLVGMLKLTKTEAEQELCAHMADLEKPNDYASSTSDEGLEKTFRLPAMLQRMEEDALEGTAIAKLSDRDTLNVPVTSVAIPLFRLPEMLQIIGDEAFEGSVAVIIELPEGVESIGERAFAGNTSLRSIRIPEKTQFIGQNAFEGSHQVMISGTAGSYARAWARENGIPFSPVTMICAALQNLSVNLELHGTDVETVEDGFRKETEALPVWRIGEIKAEFYEIQIAHQVQGRSPPVCA